MTNERKIRVKDLYESVQEKRRERESEEGKSLKPTCARSLPRDGSVWPVGLTTKRTSY
jgi:hypothetical protein